ncbi:hypothetical protein [Actinoplanes sp. NPDC023714]|uniref:hypothetical protein n=1 Tax=Actinoplanes sp. NPDC023714 TaxID=3154322 RepID=UPI0033FAD3B4
MPLRRVRPLRRIVRWAVPLLVALGFAALANAGDRISTPTPDPTAQAAQDPPVQEQFMAGINDDRGRLYAGVASAKIHREAEVDKPFPLSLTVCASPAAGCAVTPSALSSTAPGTQDLGSVLVGGRVRATATSYDPKLVVTPAGEPVQTITQPADAGEWRWSVVAGASGDFTLTIAITTLRADSEVALLPTKFFEIRIHVDTTAAKVLGVASRNFWTILGGTAGLAALITAVVAYLAYRSDRLARRPSPAAPSVPPPPPPSPAPPRPRRRRR